MNTCITIDCLTLVLGLSIVMAGPMFVFSELISSKKLVDDRFDKLDVIYNTLILEVVKLNNTLSNTYKEIIKINKNN